jgi:imidazolonepropionase
MSLSVRRDRQRPLFLANIRQLLTLRSVTSGPRRGPHLGDLNIIEDGAVLCHGGKIISVGTTKDALRDAWLKKNRRQLVEIDCSSKVVLPGFVDSHTHPAFVAPRLVDFEKRISGATYEEIAAAGGGIRASLEAVRASSRSGLANHIVTALKEMAAHGTTTVEAKSGYGLSLESELKSLEAIRTAAAQWPGSVLTTLLGAHVVPKEFSDRRSQYIDIICDQMIPSAAKRKLARFVDVFCDKGAFSLSEAERIFAAAQKNNLDTRAHVSQLSETALSSLLRFRPASLDHMDHVGADDISRLAKTETVATLVPGANYFLGLSKFPPARKFIEAGVAVALATDYNPGSSPTTSMPLVLSLACTHMQMTPAEAISASTVNGACALRVAGTKGTIEAGKDADLAVFDLEDYREIPYWFGVNRCAVTITNGLVSTS